MKKQSVLFKTSISWQLLQVAINAKHIMMEIADKYNLTVMQLYTLCLLETNTSIPMNSLSCKLNCDASNITGIVDRLFSHGYITREENPQDRREKIITLTKKGTKLCEKIAEETQLFQPEWLHSLTVTQKKQFQSLLTQALSLISSNTPITKSK